MKNPNISNWFYCLNFWTLCFILYFCRFLHNVSRVFYVVKNEIIPKVNPFFCKNTKKVFYFSIPLFLRLKLRKCVFSNPFFNILGYFATYVSYLFNQYSKNTFCSTTFSLIFLKISFMAFNIRILTSRSVHDLFENNTLYCL